MLFPHDLTSVERNTTERLLYTFDLPKWEMGLRQLGNMAILLCQRGQKRDRPAFFILTVVLF